MAVSGTIAGTVNVQDTRTIGITTSKDVGTGNTTISLTIADGTGAGQANKVYQAIRTLSGSSEDLDLAGGVTDVTGATLTFTRIVALIVENLSTSNTITVGDDATAPWSSLLGTDGTFTLRPATSTGQSMAMFFAPDATAWAVTATTADILQVAGTSGQSYRIVVIGS